jgi:Cu-processing system ATP-binding protein
VGIVIAYHRFTKRFGDVPAVDDVTLEIPAGAVVALLGPNGSGKTTTIKAAAGLIRPTAGGVFLGAPPAAASDPAARRCCSFLPQRVSFSDALTGRDVIEFYRHLRGAAAARTGHALEFAGLNGASSRAVGTYSGGMLQRLGLAVAVMADAAVLLLDEPSAALDPEGLAALYRVIDQRRSHGATVFFSSHQLGDVERMADRIAVLVRGRLVAMLGTREVAERLADRGVMRVRLAAPVAGLIDRLRELSPAVEIAGDELVVPAAASARPRLLDVIRSAGGEIRGLTVQEGRLDQFYQELVEKHS